MSTTADQPISAEEFAAEWKRIHEDYYRIKDAALARLIDTREALKRRLIS